MIKAIWPYRLLWTSKQTPLTKNIYKGFIIYILYIVSPNYITEKYTNLWLYLLHKT